MSYIPYFRVTVENIKMHLYLLHQKEQREQEKRMQEVESRPFVAAEGDLLNRSMSRGGERQGVNLEVRALDQQLVRLDEIARANAAPTASRWQ